MDDIKALTFDTGGTVLDWHNGLSVEFARAGSAYGIDRDWAAITNDYRRSALARMKGQVAPSFNIDDVHRETLETILADHNLSIFGDLERASIAGAWHRLDAWPDFVPAVDRIRKRRAVVSFTILSVALVVDVSRRNGLVWDCVISCEMLDVYKPNGEAYLAAARLLQLDPSEILMVACHNADLLAAKQQGFRTAFVHRPTEWGKGAANVAPDPEIDLVAQDFLQLAGLLGA